MLQKIITLGKELGSKVKAYLNKDNIAAKKKEVSESISQQYDKAKELVDKVIPAIEGAAEVAKEKVAPLTDAVNAKAAQAKEAITEVAKEVKTCCTPKEKKCVIDEVAKDMHTEMADKVFDEMMTKSNTFKTGKFSDEETDRVARFYQVHNVDGKLSKEKLEDIADQLNRTPKSIQTKIQHLAKSVAK